MRQIKFRLWDGNNKYFIYPDILELNIGLEYQQYTGMKDRTGKELYEGDIISPCLINGSFVMAEVKWVPGIFAIESLGVCKEIEWLCEQNIKNIEIIGNIYETKETP